MAHSYRDNLGWDSVMMNGTTAAALLIAALAGTALAQGRPAAEAPPALESDEPGAVSAWMTTHVRVGPEWRTRSYASDSVILSDRGMREDAEGKVQARIRIEATSPRDDFGWRSGLLTTTVDCAAAVIVLGPDLDVDKLLERLRTGPSAQTTLTVYKGQNLTGESASAEVDQRDLARTPVGNVLSEVCRFAVAERLDTAAARYETPVLARDQAGLDAWAGSSVDLRGWRESRHGDGYISYLSEALKVNGSKVTFSIRTEYVEPTLGSSAKLKTQMSMKDPKTGATVYPLSGRPIWVRSYVSEYRVNCSAKTYRALGSRQFMEHDLKRESDQHRAMTRDFPIAPRMIDLPLFQAACARAKAGSL